MAAAWEGDRDGKVLWQLRTDSRRWRCLLRGVRRTDVDCGASACYAAATTAVASCRTRPALLCATAAVWSATTSPDSSASPATASAPIRSAAASVWKPSAIRRAASAAIWNSASDLWRPSTAIRRTASIRGSPTVRRPAPGRHRGPNLCQERSRPGGSKPTERPGYG